MKNLSLLIPIFLFMIVLLSLDRFFFKNNKYFSLNLISPQWEYIPQFEATSQDLSSYISQPYSYLAKGNQSFVFISKDRKTVLKFLRLSKAVRFFSLKRKKSGNASNQTILNCKDASENLCEETGIIHTHFIRTNALRQKVQIIDYLGNSYFLELDNIPFILQKKAEPFISVFKTLSLENAKKVIQNILELYLNLYQKQFIDRDPIFEKNLGLIDLKPIIFDFGQIEKCPELPSKHEYLLQMTNSLKIQVQKEFPELLPYYFEILQKI